MSRSFDHCLVELDNYSNQMKHGIITRSEWEWKVIRALGDYFDDEGPGDDVDFLLEYAREPLERWAHDPLNGDREAPDRFNRAVRRLLHYPAARASLLELLDQAASADDGGSLLIDLCATGHRDHSRIFLFDDLVLETICTARGRACVSALVAAIDPKNHSPQQLGHPDHAFGRPRHLVFASLAELAARSDPVGIQALDALVDLCGHWQTAALASVHIPAHRLSRQQRGSLADAAEALEDLLDANTLQVPGHEANRAPASIRSVLWLANDATRLAPNSWEA
jgi:hypothetical protein